jgi:hypothetical protein
MMQERRNIYALIAINCVTAAITQISAQKMRNPDHELDAPTLV